MNKMLCLCLTLGGFSACSQPEAVDVRLNQVGYYPRQEKVAVVDGGRVDRFTVVDVATGTEVFSGTPAYTAFNSWSPKERTVLDFSGLQTPGKYLLKIDGGEAEFEVKDGALSPLADAALKSFYYQRTGMPIEAQYAGKWSRPAGHPDTHVMIHPSAAGPVRKAGDIISSPKGWYDAGDYNKYIVNSGYSIGLMQAIYRLFPDYFAQQNVNIPESGNQTPDFLDEMYYNLSWMLTMQDPADGGVYHKLTTPSFEGFIKPTECKQQRYVVRKSVTAALDFAASMTQASLLFAPYEKDYPGFAKQDINIPESGNRTPDLLDEMHYNLSWMLTMQDPADGGVYHKLTTPSFEAFIKPTECKQQRYVVQKSVTAALDFAASLAQASQLFVAYEEDYPGFARQALEAARRAYDWAVTHPDALYKQEELNRQYDPDVSTGAYGDRSARDEFFWAASELYYVTGDRKYRDKAVECAPDAYSAPSWGSTSPLGCFVWLLPARELDEADRAFADRLESLLLAYADQSVKGADQSAFHAPYGDEERDFFWGCLSEQGANQATSLVYAYLLSGNKDYLANAYRNMDYILGRNATGYCYVTGFGSKSPMHPHHRLSAADDVAEPLPGFLVGGPNAGQQDGAAYPSSLPDESYADEVNSYASNEIAINWSAGLVALSSALDALSGQL